MDNARFLQLRQLFDEFVQLPIRERSSFLDQLSRTDAEMASELAKYLSAHDKAGSLSMTPPNAQPLVIGPYRILKRVGGGGMGEVFQAVRDDGAFRKYVALKLIREDFIREEQAVERFQAERQVLAALEHPNVARILDGGNTEGGAPYYVMELV
ncbi:MAG: protein kinase, partial [Bryobacteraceae bacterium]|nr:protein kinase [Bryobacteraceae bacterium]